MNKVKNLGYDKWLIYEQPRQAVKEKKHLSLSFELFHIYFTWVLLLKRNIIALEIRHIEINAFSSESTVLVSRN